MKQNIGVIGLGYVGLPLAVEFAKKYNVVGFDINERRISELLSNRDSTFEISEEELSSVQNRNKKGSLFLTSEIGNLKECTIFIVTVPTPIDDFKNPDLNPLISATTSICKVLKRNDVVVYESTVYPGVTEEVLVPIIETKTNLEYNKDFFCGYSPERINPGDKEHTFKKIRKVVSGSNPKISKYLAELYSSVVVAGVYEASSIKVAEASKVIENTQRDINIAFVNELSRIFDLMNIDTLEVLEAAETKWNFLPFRPGLVGGHCIGVDPYYLAQKAQSLGYNPEMILSGRRINDYMGKKIANDVMKLSIKNSISNPRCLILGFTFKEDCPDYRNTKVIDIYHELIDSGMKVSIYDPLVDKELAQKDYNIVFETKDVINQNFDIIILAVNHSEFKNYDWKELASKAFIYDVKGGINKKFVTKRL